MKKIVLILFILTCFALAGMYNLSYVESQFTFEVENGFDRVKADKMVAVGDVGSPELPVHSLVLIIPNGQRVADVEIVSMNTSVYSTAYDIYPLQPLHKMNEDPPPWIPQDAEIYDNDAIYPDSPVRVIEHGRIDGIPVVSIAVAPLLYNPVHDRLYLVQDVTFSLNFVQSNYASRPRIRSQIAHEIWKEHVKSSVFNDWEVDMYYQPADQTILMSSYGQPTQEPSFHDVVIVSPPGMSGAFKPLERWLMEKGMPTKIVTTNWIYANYDGMWDSTDYAGFSREGFCDNASQIKEFLYDSWYNDGACYALLVGIAETGMPYRQLYGPASAPTDLYYHDFDGGWWYQDPSRFEEMWVGRVPAWNYEQAASWVYKRLVYEKSPANLNELSCALWISEDNEPYWKFKSLMDETIRITGFENWMEQHKVVDHPCNPSNHGLIDTLNKGYGFCSHYGHGAGDTWKVKYYTSGPKELLVSWDWDDYPSYEEFRNKDKYYVAWSVGCATAQYDTILNGSQNHTGWDAMQPLPCCAEGFVSWYDLSLQQPGYPIGAVAYDGDVRGGSIPDFLMHRNYISLIRGGSIWHGQRLGNIHAKQKYAPLYGPDNIDIHYCMNRHLFGSPEIEIWCDTPRFLVNEHVEDIEMDESEPSLVTVTVFDVLPESGELVPLQDATVILYRGCPPTYQIFKLGRTDSEGKVSFTVFPEDTGWIKVTSTARGHVPCQTEIKVVNEVENIAGGKPKEIWRDGGQIFHEFPGLVFDIVVPTVVKNTIKLKYVIPQTQNVRLDVYDITGSRIAVMERMAKPGVYDYSLKNLGSGAYFIVLKGKETITRKVLVVR